MLTMTEYFDKQLVLDATNPQTAGESSSGGQALGVLYRARVILFTNSIVPGKLTTLAQLTQPTYNGYASQQVTWGAPVRDPAYGIGTEGDLHTFQMLDSLTPTAVYGYGITDPSGTILYGAEVFQGAPLSLTDTLSVITFAPEWIANNASPGAAALLS